MVVVMITQVSTFVLSYQQTIVQARIQINMSNDLYESLVKKDISFFDQSKTGDIISRLDSDVQVMTDTIAFSFTQLLKAVLFLPLALVVMSQQAAPMVKWTLLCLVPLCIVIPIFGNIQQKLQKKLQDAKSDFNNLAE